MPLERMHNGTDWVDVLSAPANMMTNNTYQGISAQKDFQATVRLLPGTPSDATTTTISSPTLTLSTRYWNGTIDTVQDTNLQLVRRSVTPGDYYLNIPAETRATSLYDNGNRVWSASNVPTTMVTTDTTQTITGPKTFLSTGTTVTPFIVKQNNPQSVNLATFLDYNGVIMSRFNYAGALVINTNNSPNLFVNPTVSTNIGVVVRGAAAQAGNLQEWQNNTATVLSRVAADGAIFDNGNRVYSASNLVPVAGLSATGTPSATTYLRGDNTWATISGGGGGTSSATYTLDTDYDATSPAVPTSGILLYAKSKARNLLGSIGPNGVDIAYQPGLFANRVCVWNAVANSATATQIGLAVTEITAGVANAQTATSFYTMMVKERFSSTATAGTSTGIRTAVAQWTRSSIRNAGGFFYVARFGLGAVTATNRVFVGLHTATGAIANVNPSTLINMVGIGCDSTQTTLRMMTNDGTGTATAIDLGANFPSTGSAGTAFYEFRMFCPPGDGTTAGNIYWSVERLDIPSTYTEGTIVTDMPTANSFMAAHMWHNNGTTAAAATIDIQSLYVETDN